MKGILINRKGQQQMTIASLGVIAIALVVAVVILGMGATVLDKIQATQKDSSADHANESFTFLNNTVLGFSESTISTGSVVVYNKSNKVSTGYTVTSSSITLVNTTVRWSLEANDINVSYSYTIGSEARNSTGYGIGGVVTMAEFVPTIAIVAAAAIVIGILFAFFVRKKE